MGLPDVSVVLIVRPLRVIHDTDRDDHLPPLRVIVLLVHQRHPGRLPPDYRGAMARSLHAAILSREKISGREGDRRLHKAGLHGQYRSVINYLRSGIQEICWLRQAAPQSLDDGLMIDMIEPCLDGLRTCGGGPSAKVREE